MSILHQAMLITSLLVVSWLLMMLVHELGHILGALATGGRVHRLIWHPLVFSQTDVMPNPSPLVVAWMGPIVGIVLPVLPAGVASWRRWSMSYAVVFFAGFCLLVNGAYIGLGHFQDIGDTAVMAWLGTPTWVMIAFGLLTAPPGLWLLHRASSHLGFGRPRRPVNPAHAYGMLAIAILTVALGFLVGDMG